VIADMSDPAKPIANADDVLAFWRDAGADKWFKKDAAFDAEIKKCFLATHEAAAAGKLADWEATPIGALALTILLDQFPRNMFRDDARAYATDALALDVVERAIARGFDKEVDKELHSFFYVPFMHSETLADQERGIALYLAEDNADGAKWAKLHADIVRRFGRFPHRNKVLGRATTPQEQAFLDGGGFAG
jgi:uncharacterized protein (DUF924 family)